MPPANRAGDQFDTLVVVRHKPVLEDSLKPSRLCRVSGRNGGQFTSGCDHRTPADRRMVLGLQRKPSPFWAQNALPKGVHASSITVALCPVKQGQLQISSPNLELLSILLIATPFSEARMTAGSGPH